MSRLNVYARNLGAVWVGYAVNLAVMFFMSPFVVHSLGDAAYGIWTLMISITGYLGLAELGMGAALGRHINFHLGRGEVGKVNGVISTALAFFAACGVPLLGIGLLLTVSLGSVFTKIPAELLGPARWAILILVIDLWLSFFRASFVQVLTAHERFDISNAIQIGFILARAVLTLAALSLGRGLLELALIEVACGTVVLAATALAARRVFPALRVGRAWIGRDRFRELFHFGFWSFVGNVAGRLLYWTDSIVIALLLGPADVTAFAIAAMLIFYARTIVHQSTAVLGPQVIQHCAASDWPALQRLFSWGTTFAMTLAIPILVGMIAFGRPFLVLWMGPAYEGSYPVLAILACSQIVALAGSVIGTWVFSGLNRVRLGASVTLVQGLCNLACSVALVLAGLGVVGVALGSLAPRVIFSLLCMGMAMRWIGLGIPEFVRRFASRWVLLAGGFAVICAAVNQLPLPFGWAALVLKVALSVLIYLPAAWLVVPEPDRRRIWRTTFLSKIRRAAA
ncbi:MAG: oligosaccharide flippase family protein [Phycisphaerae bacterium]|nr:oligosaccharide flippase family protein [Phycisphaerae bacterium]